MSNDAHAPLPDWGLAGEDPACARFVLYAREVRPVLEERAGALEAMYAPVVGRPEIAPTLMAGITLLQMMEGVADREAVCRCRFDLRWRFALGITGPDWRIDPSSLCVFRARIAEHRQARVALEAALEAMRRVGHLKCRTLGSRTLGSHLNIRHLLDIGRGREVRVGDGAAVEV